MQEHHPSLLYPQMNNVPSLPEQEKLRCPRCESSNTKFCYYNNYNLSQPRYFCKSCKRYWTKGGALRNIPVGGGSRKTSKKSSSSSPSSSSSSSSTTKSPSSTPSPSPSPSSSSAAVVSKATVITSSSSPVISAALDHGSRSVDIGGGGGGNFGALISEGHFSGFINGLSQNGSNSGLGNFSALMGSGNLINGLSQNRSNLQTNQFGNNCLNPGSGLGSGSGSGSDEENFSAYLECDNGGAFGSLVDILSQNGSSFQLGDFGDNVKNPSPGSGFDEARIFDAQGGRHGWA